MGLVDVFPAVQGELLQMLERAGEQPPSFGLGRKDLFKFGAPPRIVWVPLGGPTGGADSRGGDAGGKVPGKLWTRRPAVAAHVWGNDHRAAELLAGRLVSAAHDVLAADYRVLTEQWDVSDEQTAKKGEVLVVTFEFAVPWTREADTYAKVEVIPISGEGVTA